MNKDKELIKMIFTIGKKDNKQINLLYNKDILENAIVQLLAEN